ncbi:MAG: hypothetical protein ABJE66_18740 [Deltaproteobacteria bacterium]
MGRLRRALRGPDRGALPIGEALHPVTLAAVALLLLNDWVLKPRFRGSFVTGKLSDIAGLVFAPVVLSAAIGMVLWLGNKLGARVDPTLTNRRLILCCAATAFGFTVVKLYPPIGDIVAHLIGHGASFYPDWTDVLCTPCVLIAYWIGRDELGLLSPRSREEPL